MMMMNMVMMTIADLTIMNMALLLLVMRMRTAMPQDVQKAQLSWTGFWLLPV